MPRALERKKEERIEARVTKDKKDFLSRAAEIRGQTLTDFLVSSAYEEATRVISLQNQIELSQRDSELFVNALLNPTEPNERLKEAAKRHRERLGH